MMYYTVHYFLDSSWLYIEFQQKIKFLVHGFLSTIEQSHDHYNDGKTTFVTFVGSEKIAATENRLIISELSGMQRELGLYKLYFDNVYEEAWSHMTIITALTIYMIIIYCCSYISALLCH